jgi:hypothetical protein
MTIQENEILPLNSIILLHEQTENETIRAKIIVSESRDFPFREVEQHTIISLKIH